MCVAIDNSSGHFLHPRGPEGSAKTSLATSAIRMALNGFLNADNARESAWRPPAGRASGEPYTAEGPSAEQIRMWAIHDVVQFRCAVMASG